MLYLKKSHETSVSNKIVEMTMSIMKEEMRGSEFMVSSALKASN